MRSNKLRVALESWNFCNEVGVESLALPSPRLADCADLSCHFNSSSGASCDECKAIQKVEEKDNALRVGDPFPSSYSSGIGSKIRDPDAYAIEKELYLASLCKVEAEESLPWYFWMIMLKNGNYDLRSGMCPYAGQRGGNNSAGDFSGKYFPCFGKGCMNHPAVYHNLSRPHCSCIQKESDPSCQNSKVLGLTGSFYGTYDKDADIKDGIDKISYFSVEWEKNPDTGSWIFRHKLKVSRKYPWLMLYLRADAISGVSGGYPHETRGVMKKVPESPNFTVRLSLNVIKGGGSASQFYLLDIGGCWKNDGRPCDGDVETDVTRYSEMIINPQTGNTCNPKNLAACPPYHITATGQKVLRNDTLRFPYTAYHYYCSPANAKHAEKPFGMCDPFSNPQPQELVQILPHPEWGVHGYPSRRGEGWVGDPRAWVLDVGALSGRLYFYQDPGTPPAKRVWPSIDVGTEIFRSGNADDMAEWTLTDFDVLVTE
eukprot:Gb_14243 [translate_table: standard]